MYAHAISVDESDLAFADFGGTESGAKRLYPAPGAEGDVTNNNAPGASRRGQSGILERETGLEPGLYASNPLILLDFDVYQACVQRLRCFRRVPPTSTKTLRLTPQRVPAKRLALPGGARFIVRQLQQSGARISAR